ncbi:MAG: ATP-binding protein [Gammaproteobacteria bacterium]|nr:ATP-binding protein [Gammaproteobacteria bacterium]MDH5802969.1 ATP-binding protein [Gammaproteobacteria bacterium]
MSLKYRTIQTYIGSLLLVTILLFLCVATISGGFPIGLIQGLLVLACALALGAAYMSYADSKRHKENSNNYIKNNNIQYYRQRCEALEKELLDVQSSLEQRIRERTTELAEARDHALKSSQIKSAFLANMSHELRTPLNAIIGYSEILEEEADAAGVEQFGPDLKKIKSAGAHLLSLVSDILDLSKIEAGKMEMTLKSLDLHKLLDEVSIAVLPLINYNTNHFILEVDPELDEIVSDSAKLSQSLINLLSNAAKFTNAGVITLSVTRSAEHNEIWFSVKDTGIGISSQEIKHLFEEFSQVDSTSTRKYGGTGLGLTISKRFTEMLGGRIDVQSESGKGTEFIIRLPLSLNRPETIAIPNTPLSREKGNDRRSYVSTVLVIDADPNALLFLPEYLQKAGFNISVAETAKRGLHLARRVDPDVILLDILLPQDEGWGCLLELKADVDLNHIPVIVLSKVDEKTKAYDMGAAHYLKKPVKEADLTRAIRNCVRKQSESQQSAITTVQSGA